MEGSWRSSDAGSGGTRLVRSGTRESLTVVECACVWCRRVKVVQLDSHRDEAVLARMTTLLQCTFTPWGPPLLCPPSACIKLRPGPHFCCPLLASSVCPGVMCSAAITAREFVTAADLASTWKVPLPIATQFLSVSGDDPCEAADPDACPAPAVSPLPMRTRTHDVFM